MASVHHLWARSGKLFSDGVDSDAVKLPTPDTMGKRIKHARLACGLSQEELARAVAKVSGSRTNKGAVSQYEADKVRNPHNATVLAMSTVTGFAQEWLINGDGPERAKLPALKIAAMNSPSGQLLRRAVLIAASVHSTPVAIANAAIEVYGTLADEPDAPDAALRRVARQANNKAES